MTYLKTKRVSKNSLSHINHIFLSPHDGFPVCRQAGRLRGNDRRKAGMTGENINFLIKK